MFFKKFKKAAEKEVQVQEAKKLLYRENVKVVQEKTSKEDAIRMVGQILVDTGYVKPDYVPAMLEREKTFSTYMGNGLALPHGVEEAKKEVLASGIAVISFPEGVDWGTGEDAKIVIGIAGVGDEHLKILSIIAEKMMSPESAAQLVSGSENEIFDILKED